MIFAIDKRKTDQKGKLCLESVDILLSKFNAEKRTKNLMVWCSWHLINSLNASFGTFIENDANIEVYVCKKKKDCKIKCYHD